MDPTHEPLGHTLAELVELTGFSERKIRHYISQKLVKGAEGKGPNARYSDETLRRLQLIRKLKDQDVEPLGRPLTLREMKNTLDSLGESQMEYLLSGTAVFSLIDTDEAQEMTPTDDLSMEARLDREYRDYHDKRLLEDAPAAAMSVASQSSLYDRLPERSAREINEWLSELGDFGKLLQRLREILGRLADEEAASAPPEGDTWLRVKSPDIEVHVKTPKSATERARLRTIQRAIQMLIEQGPGPCHR